ncbi:hypothetical protein U3516DRAFT_830860, partial [Neocallimastix sp. 'constans']
MLSYNTSYENSNVRDKKKIDIFHLPPIIMPKNQNQVKNQLFYQYQDKRDNEIFNSQQTYKKDELLFQNKQRNFELNTTTILP